MPANAAIYLPTDKIDLTALFPGTKSDKSWLRAASYFDVPLDGETVRFNVIPGDRLAQHLAGFQNYIASLPDEPESKQVASQAIQQTRIVLGLVASSEFTDHPAIWQSVFKIAAAFDGFVFVHDSILLPSESFVVGPMKYKAQTNEERRTRIEEHERRQPSQEADERKARSMARLQKEGVPAIDHLPVIEDSVTAKTRTADDIAKRAIAVCLAAVKAEGLEQPTIDSLVQKFGADKFFSPQEAAFIKHPNPSQEDRAKFGWRYECYWVLLWALGYIDTLERPEGICDVAKAVSFLRDRDATQFLEDAKLRPMAAILDEADLIYRYHWAVVNARVKNQEPLAKLEEGVVQERHYVLNWLIGYMDEEWDDISTDT